MSDPTLVQLAALGFPWTHENPGAHIILVSDEQLVNLADHPDEAIEKIHPQAAAPISLHEHCRQAAAHGATKLRVAFDYFFGGSSRSLYPDTEAFQKALKKVHDVAQLYGLGLEPSIISPLELGVGYNARTGEAGRWMHYREGLRDPQTGKYSVMLWQQTRWCNNKGPTPVKLLGARAFAFSETRVPDTLFFAVDPAAMVELAEPTIEEMPGAGVDAGSLDGGVAELDAMFQALRVRVHDGGRGADEAARGLDRVLVVLMYETVELDYFSPSAPEFLGHLVQGYHDRGISLAGVYSDEMHIQQDWSYHTHFDNGQFTVRYVSPGFERAFAVAFGAQYGDFTKYMLYFACHQHDFLPTHEPKLPSQHVLGSAPEAIAATLRFRKQYYDFLESSVVRLMVETRERLEALNGHEMDAYYHATWAESPTCDAWAVGGVHKSWSPEEHQRRYEYTPDFVWSNTVQQAAAACANYFLWNDFLTGGNNDTAEGGYADRNYYGRALACSLAALNRRPLASAGMWGMPSAVRERMAAVSAAYGVGGHPAFRSVLDYAPRDAEVLFLYPQDLVAVDERFGSWVVLYGYANYATAEKVVEQGRVTAEGRLQLKDARYRAVVALYEPFPSAALLALLADFAERGGTVIWSGPPPLEAEMRARLEALGGACYARTIDPLGLALPSRRVAFSGALAGVPEQVVLTDFVVDRIHPLEMGEGGSATRPIYSDAGREAVPTSGDPAYLAEVVATVRTGGPEGRVVVGKRRVTAGGGQVVLLGFRPSDDQAASTGVETRTWYEVLRALGAYPGDDHPVVTSRTTELLACTFPNGAVALAPHYRAHAESWPGGFYRDAAEDARLLEANPISGSDAIDLGGFRVAGQTVSYRGRHAVAWRFDAATGSLVAFAGTETAGITVDGVGFRWSDAPVDIVWHPLGEAYATESVLPHARVWVGTPGMVRVPLGLPECAIELWKGAYRPGRSVSSDPVHVGVGVGARRIPCTVDHGDLVVDVDETIVGHWLYVVTPRVQ
jgi:hypothetical protein